MRRETWSCPDPAGSDYVVEVTDDRVTMTAATFNELTRLAPPYPSGGERVNVVLAYSMFATLMEYWGWTLVMSEAPLV